MSIKTNLVACASALTLVLSSAIFAEGIGGQNYTYQPSSLMDGHFYANLNLDYSRLLVGLNTPNSFRTTPLGVTSKNIDSFILGGELGYALNHDYSLPVRLSLNLMYRPNKKFNVTPLYAGSANSGQGQIESTLFLVHAYYDFYNQSGYIPYLGLGAGLDHNTAKFQVNNTASSAVINSIATTSNTSFAWDATLGIWTNLVNNLDGDLFLRYTHLGKPATFDSTLASGATQTNALVSHLYSADLGLGLRYNFG